MDQVYEPDQPDLHIHVSNRHPHHYLQDDIRETPLKPKAKSLKPKTTF